MAGIAWNPTNTGIQRIDVALTPEHYTLATCQRIGKALRGMVASGAYVSVTESLDLPLGRDCDVAMTAHSSMAVQTAIRSHERAEAIVRTVLRAQMEAEERA